MAHSQKIEFKYTLMFQTSVLSFEFEEKNNCVFGKCHAKIKLPILKKEAFLTTEYSRADQCWIQHQPFHDSLAAAKTFHNKTESSQSTLDPISFFLAIHEKRWVDPAVNIFLGEKTLPLNIHRADNEYIIERPEKNQKLFVGVDAKGVSYFKVQVPVLGEIKFIRA